MRRIDTHIQKILAEQLIPELTAEVERLRASRELNIVKNAEVEDEQATLVMTFSNEVDIERVTLADVELAPKQKRDKWEARIDLEQFEDADAAPLQLTVEARHPAFDDRQLDDPKTVASWSTQTSSFNAYEQQPDTYHKIQLTPSVGYAIVLDTSGSMGKNGQIGPAKAALANLFASGRIKDGDTASLFTFSGECGTTQLAPFTKDLDRVVSAIQQAGADGGTPLAATIVQAANALSAQKVERRVLVVFTDGEDTCEGNVGAAFHYARTRVDAIR